MSSESKNANGEKFDGNGFTFSGFPDEKTSHPKKNSALMDESAEKSNGAAKEFDVPVSLSSHHDLTRLIGIFTFVSFFDASIIAFVI